MFRSVWQQTRARQGELPAGTASFGWLCRREKRAASIPSYLAPRPGLQGPLPPRPDGSQGGEVRVPLLDLRELQLLQLEEGEKAAFTLSAQRGKLAAEPPLSSSHIYKEQDGNRRECVCVVRQAVSGRQRGRFRLTKHKPQVTEL